MTAEGKARLAMILEANRKRAEARAKAIAEAKHFEIWGQGVGGSWLEGVFKTYEEAKEYAKSLPYEELSYEECYALYDEKNNEIEILDEE